MSMKAPGVCPGKLRPKYGKGESWLWGRNWNLPSQIFQALFQLFAALLGLGFPFLVAFGLPGQVKKGGLAEISVAIKMPVPWWELGDSAFSFRILFLSCIHSPGVVDEGDSANWRSSIPLTFLSSLSLRPCRKIRHLVEKISIPNVFAPHQAFWFLLHWPLHSPASALKA